MTKLEIFEAVGLFLLALNVLILLLKLGERVGLKLKGWIDRRNGWK